MPSLRSQRVRKSVGNVRDAGRIQVQGACLENSIRTDIAKERHRNGAGNGNAIFDVAGSLLVAAGQSRGVDQDWKSEGSLRATRSGIVVEERLRSDGGNENHWRDRANIKTTDVVAAAPCSSG